MPGTTDVCGYSTYETFHVAMLLSNTRQAYDAAITLARGVAAGTDEHKIGKLADLLETLVEACYLRVNTRELAAATDADRLAHDLLTAALGRVDYRELAEEWIGYARDI